MGATEGLYGKLAKDSATQQEALSELKGSLSTAKADTAAALADAKAVFASRVDSLTNAITANAKSFERGLDKTIVRAIQLGEAKAKAVQERAMENITTEKKA